MPQNRKTNIIIAIFRVFSIIWIFFGKFPKILKNRENFGGVGVGGKGVGRDPLPPSRNWSHDPVSFLATSEKTQLRNATSASPNFPTVFLHDSAFLSASLREGFGHNV
jgi:hypothetical protein